MSDISQGCSDDEDLASYDDNMHNLAVSPSSDKTSTMTVLGKGPLMLMGIMVMGYVYPAPLTLEKVMRCPVLLVLTWCYGQSKVRLRNFFSFNSIQPLTVIWTL